MNTHPSFVYFGTPDVAEQTLELLFQAGLVPQLIVTAPDRPVGRHFTLTPCPVKQWADAHAIPTLQPEKMTPDVIEQIPVVDFYLVVAYGKILPVSIIERPRFATLNIHYSLLPRWRGASPVEAALLHGETQTGVSIQKMVFKLDAGPVIAEEQIAIEPTDTTHTLRGKLIPLGAALLIDIITDPAHTALGSSTEQDESLATHCGKIKKEDALVSLTDDPHTLWNKYRAYHGWPTIYFLDDAGKRVKIVEATFERESFIPLAVVPEGKQRMSWEEYQRRQSQ